MSTIHLLHESPLLAETQAERKTEADRLFKQGIQQLDTRLFKEALQSDQQALKIYREIGDSPEERLRQRKGEAYSLGNLGNAYFSLGQYQKTIEFYQQSLNIAREIGDSPEERLRQRNGAAGSLGGLGNTYFSLGQYQKTIELHQQSLAIAREIGDSPEERLRQRNGVANSLNNLGNAYNNLAQYHKAIEFYQQSLAIAQEIGDEVDKLKQTLPNTTAYVDEAFTLEAMKPKMNGYNILHFATHAAFVPGDPSSESFIVFGDGENPTLRDVENWSLSNVDLVVLSACETGLGGFDNNGEQIFGLGYQFQNRGARAVIASLWQVNDGGTQLLMNEFYNALQAGNRKTKALQKAQMALITGDFSTVGEKRSRSVPPLRIA